MGGLAKSAGLGWLGGLAGSSWLLTVGSGVGSLSESSSSESGKLTSSRVVGAWVWVGCAVDVGDGFPSVSVVLVADLSNCKRQGCTRT